MENRIVFNTANNNTKFIINTKDNKQLEFTDEDIEKIAKDLKVLQVLKDKLPHITTLRVMECEDTYVLYNSINCTSITKEEYELLKEWLEK